MSKMVWSLEQIDDCFVVTRQSEVDTDEQGNSIFNTRRISSPNLQSAIKIIYASLDLILKQAEKDSKTPSNK
jgi:hypothetical protein